MEGEFASLSHARERSAVLGPEIIDFAWRCLQGDAAFVEAFWTGDPAVLAAAGPEHWMVKDMIAVLLLEGSIALEGLTWEQKGIVVGYLLPEIIQIVGATAVGTTIGPEGSVAAGGAKSAHTLTRHVAVAQRLRSSTKVAGVVEDLAVVEKLEDILERAILWPELDGLPDSRKVVKILDHYRLTSSNFATPWEVFEKSVPTLRQGGLWRQDLQKSTLDDILKQMFDGYEAGSIPRDKIPDDDALKAVLGDFGEQWCDDFILRRVRPGMMRATGRVGEKSAGLIGRPKKQVLMPSGAKRFPDGIDDQEKILIEVKNVKTQRLTPQLADYIEYCKRDGYTFRFYVRRSTVLNQDLTQKLDELEELNLYHGLDFID